MTRRKEDDYKIQKEYPTPRKAIKAYCLTKCEKKDKDNSKRSVAQCLHWKCPLYAYRRGMFRPEVKTLTKAEKKSRIHALQVARRNVIRAEQAIETADKIREEKYRTYKKYIDAVAEKEKLLREAKLKVRQLEEKYDRELEAGLWKSKGELLDGIQNERCQDMVASQDEGSQGIPQEGSDRSGGE